MSQSISFETAQKQMSEDLWWKVNIGSDNGLVPDGNKPLPVPMLTKFHDTIMASLGTNELNQILHI